MWRHVKFILSLTLIFAAERGAEVMWPELSPWAWWSIAGVLVIALFVIHFWQARLAAVRALEHYLRRGLIPLSEAGQILLNELERTEWGSIEYGLNRDDPAGYYCHALLRQKEAEVYGIRPKATNLRKLDPSEVKSGFLSEGGEHLLGHGYEEGGSREVLYESLHIKRRLLNGFLKARKSR